MQTTPNLGLPIFEAGESPAWVGDWNSTMQKLDNVGGGGSAILDSYNGNLTKDTSYGYPKLEFYKDGNLMPTFETVLTSLHNQHGCDVIHVLIQSVSDDVSQVSDILFTATFDSEGHLQDGLDPWQNTYLKANGFEAATSANDQYMHVEEGASNENVQNAYTLKFLNGGTNSGSGSSGLSQIATGTITASSGNPDKYTEPIDLGEVNGTMLYVSFFVGGESVTPYVNFSIPVSVLKADMQRRYEYKNVYCLHDSSWVLVERPVIMFNVVGNNIELIFGFEHLNEYAEEPYPAFEVSYFVYA